MRNLIIAALGMLLLVSGALATGTGNEVLAVVDQETVGTCIVGANVFQGTTLDANLLGCDSVLEQNMFVQANGNDLVGMANFEDDDLFPGMGEEGEAGEGEGFVGNNFIQTGAMIFNSTGSDVGFQDIDLIANDNCGTIGNFSQMAIQMADSIGCDNNIFQDTDAIATDNSFTLGFTTQASLMDVCVEGIDNDIDQIATQDIFNTCLTRSSTSQQAVLTQDIVGCGNTNDLPDSDEDGQVSLQEILNSDLTNSQTLQAVSLNEQITGSDNAAGQFGYTIIDNSCFTNSIATQSIAERFASLGCDNIVDQDAVLENLDNSLVGGRLVQQTSINTNA